MTSFSFSNEFFDAVASSIETTKSYADAVTSESRAEVEALLPFADRINDLIASAETVLKSRIGELHPNDLFDWDVCASEQEKPLIAAAVGMEIASEGEMLLIGVRGNPGKPDLFSEQGFIDFDNEDGLRFGRMIRCAEDDEDDAEDGGYKTEFIPLSRSSLKERALVVRVLPQIMQRFVQLQQIYDDKVVWP